MKREFLQNLKVGEEALPKEVIDVIMDENGKDITKAKSDAVRPYSDYEDIKKERDTLKEQQAEGTVDGKTAAQWKEAHDTAVENHQKELEGIKFQGVLDSAITAAKGKNETVENKREQIATGASSLTMTHPNSKLTVGSFQNDNVVSFPGNAHKGRHTGRPLR